MSEEMQKARRASQEIRDLSISQRLHLMARLQDEILKRVEPLIDRIVEETRKPRMDALVSEIFPVLDHLSFLQKTAAQVLKGKKVPTPIALLGKKSRIELEPLGVLLVISPWNYPFYQALVPCTLSFVTGNATLYKPSEHTPLKGVCEELFEKAGFKKDWIQVLYGEGDLGARLISEKPDKIFFTGSVATGKKIMRQASEDLIPVELELGGKDPAIVFEDVNLDRAASGVLWGALTHLGQSCTSVERIYVHEKVYEEFKRRLMEKIQALQVTEHSKSHADLSEITVDSQVSVIREHLEEALQKGAKLLTGQDWDRRSPRVPPLLLEGVTSDMQIAREETFGPILPLFSFSSEKEAIQAANDSAFGLSVSIWSRDRLRARRVAQAIKTGNVSINNVMLSEGNPYLPFGGVKQSGFGRFKGEIGYYSFSNLKSILEDSDSAKIEANWFPYTPQKYQLFLRMMRGLFTRGVISFFRFIIEGLRLEAYSNKVGRKK